MAESREGIPHQRHFLHQHYLTTRAATFSPLFRPDVRQSLHGLSPKDGSCGSCSWEPAGGQRSCGRPRSSRGTERPPAKRTAAELIRALSTAAGDPQVIMTLMGCKTEAEANDMLATGGFRE